MQQDNRPGGQNIQPVADDTGKSFDPRYLAAKKSIDDRALNHHVWQALRQALPRAAGDQPLHILELGAGIGTMLTRLVERGLLTGPVTYLATDSDREQLEMARHYLSTWAKGQGLPLSWSGELRGRLATARAEISVVLEPASVAELAEGSAWPGPFHLLIAHALLDLVDFPALLPPLLARLGEQGLAYCTCNFDGETGFLPENTQDLAIIDRYHASMEARLAGASRTGRRLLGFLQGPGLELLAAGSSDWIVHPRQGRYSADEAFFMHAIIETVARELAGTPGPASGPAGLTRLTAWADLRHRQVAAGALSFFARHLDFLARPQPLLP